MKTLKPGSLGHRGLIGKKVVAKEANRVSAKCAISHLADRVPCHRMPVADSPFDFTSHVSYDPYLAAWCCVEGPPKKISTDPPVHLLNPRPTHAPSDIFFLDFFLVRFWAFLGKGSSKTPHTIQIFLQKVHISISKNILHISTKISMSVFSRLFLFYRVFGCFSAMGVQKHYKKRPAKQSCRKVLTKEIGQKSKTDFF
jgi:hypothetical protein